VSTIEWTDESCAELSIVDVWVSVELLSTPTVFPVPWISVTVWLPCTLVVLQLSRTHRRQAGVRKRLVGIGNERLSVALVAEQVEDVVEQIDH
jgi:hypothetical protein